MDEILLANFMVFHDVVRDEPYDLWIGDEAWELDYFLHENPELKTASYAWLSDFVGWLPIASGGAREALLTADYNAEMIEQIARFPRVRDRAIFVGEPDDIVPGELRPGAAGDPRVDGASTSASPATSPTRRRCRPSSVRRCGRSWATGPTSASASSRSVARASVRSLLRRVVESFAEARRLVPGLRMVVVAGPRIDRTDAADRRRARDPRLCPGPAAPARGLRPGDRPGRARDDDGTDRRAAAVHLRAARTALRAERSCALPARALWRRAPPRVCRRDADRCSRTRSLRSSAVTSTTCRSRRTAPRGLRR